MMAKPKIVYWMSLALFAIALAIPLQIAFIYQHSLSELDSILQKITWLNFISIAMMMTTAYLLLNISPHLKYFAPLTILTLAWNNYLVGSYGEDFQMSQTLLGTGLFTGLFVPLLRKDLRQILSEPHRRWWRRANRHKKHVDVILNPFVGQTLQAQTFDLSESGAFIPFADKPWNEIPKVGERIKISLHLDTLRKIKCEAIVVRVVEPKGSYPKGIGVQFTNMNETYKRSLNNFLSH
jgi:PilZ domain